MEDNKIIEDKKIKKGVKGLTFNEYHKNYYIEKFQVVSQSVNMG